MLNSNGDSDDEDTGYASQTAEAGWSMTTQSILNADSSSLHERYMQRKQMDDEYARRLATVPKRSMTLVTMTTIIDGNIGPAILVVKQLSAPIATNKINPNQVKNTTVPSMNTSQDYGYWTLAQLTIPHHICQTS